MIDQSNPITDSGWMRAIPMEEIIGVPHGRVTPIEELEPRIRASQKRSRVFRCSCECGAPVITTLEHLRTGHTRSCGCLRIKNSDLEGKKFNSLLILKEIEPVYRGRQRNRRVLARCDCGSEREFDAYWVFSGLSRSCGCRIKRTGNQSPSFRGTGEIPSTYWGSLRNSAIDRNLEFNITANQVWELFLKQERKCALSGEILSFGRKPLGTASLDRINSSRPYDLDNVQWIHKDINYMKMDLPQEHFLTLCRKITEHNKHRK